MREPTRPAPAVFCALLLSSIPARSSADGASVYKASCAVCHSDVEAPKFAGRSADDVRKAIAEGKGKMAPLKLQAADADAVANFTASPSAAAAPASGPNPAALQRIASGDQAASANDSRSALFAYLDAVNLDPRSAQARLRLAGQYARMSHPAQAIEQWEFALALEPGNEEASRNLREARAAMEGRQGTPAPPPAQRGPVIEKVPVDQPASNR